jgi:hypothetical protein
LQDEIDSILCQNKILANKLVRCSSIEAELESFTREVSLLQGSLPKYQRQIAAEKERQAAIMAELAMMGPSANLDVIRRRVKKNQMKILELEAVIRKSASAPSVQQKATQETAKRKAPSLIIHRTQDSAADEVRLLRTVMEQCISENTAVRSELKSMATDLAAMQEENRTLKVLMRNLMPDGKT